MTVLHSSSIKLLFLIFITFSLVLFICIFQNSSQIKIRASGNTTFLYGSIDTMKESRDSSCTGCQLTYAQIQNDVNLSATLNNNYITVDTFGTIPLMYNSGYRQFVQPENIFGFVDIQINGKMIMGQLES